MRAAPTVFTSQVCHINVSQHIQAFLIFVATNCVYDAQPRYAISIALYQPVQS